MKKVKAVICDLDGTLFNIDHRLHYLEEKNWGAFFEAAADDTPNKWCVELLRGMKVLGHEIIFVSGRNSIARKVTESWLEVLGFEDSKLFMRPKWSRSPDFKLKEQIYETALKEKDILFVVEDRSQVVDMWRSKGLTVLQCDEGEF